MYEKLLSSLNLKNNHFQKEKKANSVRRYFVNDLAVFGVSAQPRSNDRVYLISPLSFMIVLNNNATAIFDSPTTVRKQNILKVYFRLPPELSEKRLVRHGLNGGFCFQYLGTWYEAEHYVNIFEIGTRCVKTNYTKAVDGRYLVSNEIMNRLYVE